MSKSGFAPFVLGTSFSEDGPTAHQSAPAPADPLAVAQGTIIRGDKLARAIGRYATLLNKHGAILANGYQPSDAIMSQLLGQLSSALRELALSVPSIRRTGNSDALAKSVRRGLPEEVQPRHDDLMRIVERGRRARKQSTQAGA